MRRSSYDNKNSCSSVKRNFVGNQGYEARSFVKTTTTTKDVDSRRMNSCSLQASANSGSHLQRSVSADNVIVRSRGFKPSDRHDPAKRHFLEHLTSKILHFEMDSGEPKPIDLQKLLTPAMDSSDLMLAKHKKMYASSCFYAPTHPTVEDQVELARRISYSLSDVKNMKSKGQSMYVNRKKRSVKWIHDGNGDEGEEEPSIPMQKDKIPLKCMMNPNGKVMDIQGIQAMGEEVNIGTSPINAGKLFDIVRDLNNQKGRGAEIFAKRRKRSEKWVVDKEQCQTPTTPSGFTKAPSFPNKLEMPANENSKFTNLPPLMTTTPLQQPQPFDTTAKPFYNPFTLDLSLESVTPSRSGSDQRRGSLQSEASMMSPYNGEVKKIYLREVAVGTDSDYPTNVDRVLPMEKSKRTMSFNESQNGSSNGTMRRSKPSTNITTRNPDHTNGKPRQEMSRRGSDRQHQNSRHHHQNPQKIAQYHQYDKYQTYDQQEQSNNEIPDDYTPVPVKQLIQEFEKTCRPVMQYKQISPKIIPINHQQFSPLDNDISRFFESSRITNKYDDQQQQMSRKSDGNIKRSNNFGQNNNGNSEYSNGNEKMEYSNGTSKLNYSNGNVKLNYSNGNGKMEYSNETGKFNYSNGNGKMDYIDGNGKMDYSNGNSYRNGSGRQQQTEGRYEDYESTDDEIDDSFGDSDDDEVNYRRSDGQRIIYDDESQSLNNGNDTRATSNGTMDEYEMYVRQFDESSELFEAPPGFRNTDYTDCEINGQNGQIINEPKSMVLAMVASQDDILDTIKHLRNTPVLENLVGAPEPDFYADIGTANKIVEPAYQGPKIASYQTLTNYNTAPRGWDQSQSFYRPVTFGKQQEPIAYSDF